MTRIVVGGDGSPGSVAALDWAMALARRWSADVAVVHAWDVTMPYLAPNPTIAEAEAEQAEGTARATLEAMTADLPDAEVELRTVRGPAVATLVRAAGDADLLVVGARDSVRQSGIGSTATRCAVRSEVPTAVIPVGGEAASDGPVVAGIDGSATGARALRAALDLAEPDRQVVAVTAWAVPAIMHMEQAALDPDVFEDEGRWVLDEATKTLPDVEQDRVTPRLRRGDPRSVLLDEALRAKLLVVGTKGHSILLHRLLGSTVTHLLHHHPTPVVVVPSEVDPRHGR